MKKKNLINKEVKLNNNIKTSTGGNIGKSASKALIKGSDQRRLLKKLSRVSNLLKDFPFSPSEEKEKKSKKLRNQESFKRKNKKKKKRGRPFNYKKFADLKWRRKLKRRFRLFALLQEGRYGLKVSHKVLRRTFLHKYISSYYKRSFIARHKARVSVLLHLQGLMTNRFYGRMPAIKFCFSKYPSKKVNKVRFSLAQVLRLFKQIRNLENGKQPEFVLQDFWKLKLARFLFK